MTKQTSNFDAHNTAYVERLYQSFLSEPKNVPPAWRRYFSQMNGEIHDRRAAIGPAFRPSSIFHSPTAAIDDQHVRSGRLQDRVTQLIRAHRVRGHLVAQLDPLGLAEQAAPPELDPAFHGLSESDLERTFSTSTIGGPETQTLRDIIERLRNTYCRYIGVQFMHIDELDVRDWLIGRMEEAENRIDLSREEQLRILTRLTDAVIFERFVRKKYVGAKTFSLEGSESLIPLLDLAIEKASAQGTDEIVLGMAHRGRLNVLANVIGKTPREIFWEFEDPAPERHVGRGDVVYHLGFSGDWTAASERNVHLSLCFNPSHLEFVNPVAMGRMRAKQDRADDVQRRKGMTLLIHGDAGFAGEGIVQESLNLSGLPSYTVGGTLHVVVNNRLGFTTPPAEGRSTTYATDVARMLQIPIFHVNGEHSEAVAQVVTLVMDFREKFQRDVVIDMYGYRRWGHNESDEPSFTQPLRYTAIEHRPSVRDGYLEHLLELEGISREEADEIGRQRHEELQREFDQARDEDYTPDPQTRKGIWNGFAGGEEPDDEPDTGFDAKRLSALLGKLTETPTGFQLHRKLKRSIERRQQMAEGEQPLDWSAAEALAIATLAVEGHPVRLAGQDSARGTFSQRHAVLHDVVDGNEYEIFQHLSDDQAPVEIINSPLSEAGALGFEYGYSLDHPRALVCWEAQYGDFANAGQVIIDQFIASAEDKWRRLSGLVLLLPHGFEGMGPEHSSARLERFLTLTGDHNIQIASPSTPAQYFHILRRQVLRPWRKPLILLTPKSLLRHPRVVSPLDSLANGRFLRVLPDEREKANETTRVLLCSGKMYCDLAKARDEEGRDDIAIVRIEQFYPLSAQHLLRALENYDDGCPVVWVQEEPENMGAWLYWKGRFGERLLDRFSLSVVARAASASPATGSSAAHRREQSELIERAFN